MRDYKEHIIKKEALLTDALSQLDRLAPDATLFVVDDFGRLTGSLTYGDVRRGLLQGKSSEENLTNFIQPNPKIVHKANYSIHEIIKLREQDFKLLPVLDDEKRIINVINFRLQKSYLPLDAILMAGGRGSRLRPMTDTTPKPLLKIGEKSIIDYSMDRLSSFGIDNFHISLRYLGEQIEDHFKQKKDSAMSLNFVWEQKALGTIGAVSLINEFNHDYVLITNSDILTNMDYEDFFLDFMEQDADMSVATIPYCVDIPYAVIETDENRVLSLKEKPTYTYYSNAGIYLCKKSVLNKIPKNSFYNTTDLMKKVIEDGEKLISYPIRQYWLDVGKNEDFSRAQLDVKKIDL